MRNIIWNALVAGFKIFVEFAIFAITTFSFFASIYFIGSFIFVFENPCPWYLIFSPFLFFFGLGLMNEIDFD